MYSRIQVGQVLVLEGAGSPSMASKGPKTVLTVPL